MSQSSACRRLTRGLELCSKNLELRPDEHQIDARLASAPKGSFINSSREMALGDWDIDVMDMQPVRLGYSSCKGSWEVKWLLRGISKYVTC